MTQKGEGDIPESCCTPCFQGNLSEKKKNTENQSQHSLCTICTPHTPAHIDCQHFLDDRARLICILPASASSDEVPIIPLVTFRPNTLPTKGLPADEGRVSGQILCAGIEVTLVTPHTHASITRGKTQDMGTGPHKELKETVTSFLMPTYRTREYSVSVLCAPAWSARLLSTRFLSHCELLS